MSTHVSVPATTSGMTFEVSSVLHRARVRFRVWRGTRPFWAGLWAIVGGVIVAYVPATAFKFVMFGGTLLWAGITVGVLIAVFGLFLWIQPQFRALLGVMILILSLLSFFTSDFGGFFIGMLTAMTGGSMALAWTVRTPKASDETASDEGRVVNVDFTVAAPRPQTAAMVKSSVIGVWPIPIAFHSMHGSEKMWRTWQGLYPGYRLRRSA